MAEVKKSMSVPMALLDLRHRTPLETNRALKRRILILGLWSGCFSPRYPAPADGKWERLSGFTAAQIEPSLLNPERSSTGLPTSVFLKGHEVTHTVSERGDRLQG